MARQAFRTLSAVERANPSAPLPQAQEVRTREARRDGRRPGGAALHPALGAEKVTREIAENTLSVGFDNLDAKLARVGYTPKALAERFDAQPAEIRRFLSGRLDPERTAELGAALRDAGIPT